MDGTERDDGGACGPYNLRKKVACRTVVGRWWGDGWESAMGGVGQGGKDDLL